MLDNVGGGGVSKKSVRRSAAERAVIVAESFEAGATVASVARRHGIVASQLSTWRTAAKRKSGEDSSPAFADLSVMPDALPTAFDGIEVVVGGVIIRLPKNTTPKRIADIAHRLAQGA
jgi:transposase